MTSSGTPSLSRFSATLLTSLVSYLDAHVVLNMTRSECLSVAYIFGELYAAALVGKKRKLRMLASFPPSSDPA